MKWLLALIILASSLCNPLRASDGWKCCEPCQPALLSLGVGIFDVFPRRDSRLQFQLEYKFAANWYGVQPFLSAFFTDKGSFYACFGACYDIFLGKHFVLTPSFAPGFYAKGGGKNLGFPLEFRSSLSLAAQFRNCHRLGVQFYHISNASLRHKKNPGVESLIFYYSIATW